MHLSYQRPGYVFLVSALVIGLIVTVTTVTLLILGNTAEQSGQTIVETNQALELAHTCADRALLAVREDPAYTGNETLNYTHGTCRIFGVMSNLDSRTICVEGERGGVIRSLQIALDVQWRSSSASSIPDPLTDPPRVATWNEISCCPGSTTCAGSSSSSS
jgi:hypothetical protein